MRLSTSPAGGAKGEGRAPAPAATFFSAVASFMASRARRPRSSSQSRSAYHVARKSGAAARAPESRGNGSPSRFPTQMPTT